MSRVTLQNFLHYLGRILAKLDWPLRFPQRIEFPIRRQAYGTFSPSRDPRLRRAFEVAMLSQHALTTSPENFTAAYPGNIAEESRWPTNSHELARLLRGRRTRSRLRTNPVEGVSKLPAGL